MVKTDVEHATWGQWPSIRLSTGSVSLEVVGELGARVVSLRDLGREREWMVQGEPPAELEQMAWAEEQAPFGPRESFGWDECLPTTLPCADPLDRSAHELRDHGDQWGRGAYLSTDPDPGAVTHTWSVPRWPYRFSRRLSFEDERTLLARYVLVSLSDGPMPITWAQHALFELETGATIDLPGVTRVRPSAPLGIELPDEIQWPTGTLADGTSLELGRIDRGRDWATVVYADPRGPVRAEQPDGACVEVEWDRDFAPMLRVWLSQSGWPPEGPANVQFGLEPVTSADDDLASAMAHDRAVTLPPRGELRWWVRMRLS